MVAGWRLERVVERGVAGRTDISADLMVGHGALRVECLSVRCLQAGVDPARQGLAVVFRGVPVRGLRCADVELAHLPRGTFLPDCLLDSVAEAGAGAIDMMRAVKRALDPQDILNPGKIFAL